MKSFIFMFILVSQLVKKSVLGREGHTSVESQMYCATVQTKSFEGKGISEKVSIFRI